MNQDEDWSGKRVFETEVFYVDENGFGYIVVLGDFWVVTHDTAYPLTLDSHMH